MLGALLAALALVPGTYPSRAALQPVWRRLLALLAGALSATLLLWALERAGLSLAGSLGLLVGGYSLVWFLLAGLLAILFLGGWRDWLGWPARGELLSGLLGAAALWLGIGLLGGEIWLPWLLIPQRLVLWPFGVGCMLPWFLAVGQASSPATPLGRTGWWLAQCAFILGSLFLALRINQGLFFLLLILPVFPALLGAHALASGRQRSPWAFALSAALFTSWALLAVFPFQ